MAWDRFELTNFLQVTVVLGAQWGDEGKGKVVDMLATKMDVVCRCQVSQTLFFFFVALCYHVTRFSLIIHSWLSRSR